MRFPQGICPESIKKPEPTSSRRHGSEVSGGLETELVSEQNQSGVPSQREALAMECVRGSAVNKRMWHRLLGLLSLARRRLQPVNPVARPGSVPRSELQTPLGRTEVQSAHMPATGNGIGGHRHRA